jgi:hypothetical protein
MSRAVAPGSDIRLAFVGDPQRFGSWLLRTPAGGVTPLHVAPLDRDARARLEGFRPHVVVVLDVDAVPAPVYEGLGAAVLAVAAPDDRAFDAPAPGPVEPPAPAVGRRLRGELALLRAARRLPGRAGARVRARLDWRATQLPPPPAPAYDRLVALDRVAARGRPLWRLVPPPVDDGLFAPAARIGHRPRAAVLVPPTAHRERMLLAAKHRHDLRHVAHGVTAQMLGEVDVGVVVRAQAWSGFEHAVAVHLAAGHLVVCDRQEPWHGLEPGIDLLDAADDRGLAAAVGAALAGPDAHFRVRVRGRQKAERFRASRVWPALARDLLVELRGAS